MFIQVVKHGIFSSSLVCSCAYLLTAPFDTSLPTKFSQLESYYRLSYQLSSFDSSITPILVRLIILASVSIPGILCGVWRNWRFLCL